MKASSCQQAIGNALTRCYLNACQQEPVLDRAQREVYSVNLFLCVFRSSLADSLQGVCDLLFCCSFIILLGQLNSAHERMEKVNNTIELFQQRTSYGSVEFNMMPLRVYMLQDLKY